MESGERAARLLSIVSSAKRHSLDIGKVSRRPRSRFSWETVYAKLISDIWKHEHPGVVRIYRKEESRYKADRKQVTRARRVLAAKLKQ